MVDRCNVYPEGLGEINIDWCPEGEYVEYVDYEALTKERDDWKLKFNRANQQWRIEREECADLTKERDELKATVKNQADRLEELRLFESHYLDAKELIQRMMKTEAKLEAVVNAAVTWCDGFDPTNKAHLIVAVQEWEALENDG